MALQSRVGELEAGALFFFDLWLLAFHGHFRLQFYILSIMVCSSSWCHW